MHFYLRLSLIVIVEWQDSWGFESMKKIFMAMIAGVSLLACNNSDNGGDLTDDTTTMQGDTINPAMPTDTSMNNTIDTGMGTGTSTNRNPVDSAGLRDNMRKDTRVDSTR
jgi:hypothetical protein